MNEEIATANDLFQRAVAQVLHCVTPVVLWDVRMLIQVRLRKLPSTPFTFEMFSFLLRAWKAIMI